MVIGVLVSLIAGASSEGAGVSERGSGSFLAEATKQPEPRSETRRCKDHRRGLRFYRQRHREHLAVRGAAPPSPGRSPRSCADARYLAIVARKRAARARTQTERWINRHVLVDGHGWLHAVQQAQKPYPGSRSWLLACSASEGGWGRFVWNRQGSGAYGPMQFMSGTFAGMSWRARVDAASRGFVVPASASSWGSYLGQALAGAWAYRNGQTGHWSGHGC